MLRPSLAAALAAAVTASPVRAETEALASARGTLRLDRLDCVFEPRLHSANWTPGGAKGGLAPRDDGSYDFTLEGAAGTSVRGRAAFARAAQGMVEADYTFTPARDVSLNSLHVGSSFPAAALAGGTWTADVGRTGAIPEAQGDAMVFVGRTRSFSLAPANKAWQLRLEFAEPTPVLLQDDRQWGPTFSVRIGYSGPTRTFAAGEPFAVRFSVGTDQPLRLVRDLLVTLEAGPDWLPFANEPDIVPGSALDFSALGFSDAPAGKHGRVVAKGPHFEFEGRPGVAQRFYGVNVCFSANFLEPADAERFAQRLSRIGYNALRLHHHDGGLVANAKDGTTLDPANLARMDALVAACVRHGIYLTTDLYVSRRVPWRTIGIDRDGEVPPNTFKLLVAVHEGVFTNLASFARQWLTHQNPLTGRSLAAEPALAWISLVNEGNYGNYLRDLRKLPEWQAAWRDWLARRSAAEPEATAGIPDTIPGSLASGDRHAAAFSLFLNEVETRFFSRLRTFLRDELGCRALLTNQNAWTFQASDQVVRHRLYDYADDHFYVDHPHFLEQSWSLPSRCDNRNPVRNEAMGAQGVVFTRLLDKPFTITEYNYSGPGRFRGVGGIVTGTLGALQDWAGVWRFAFSHNADSIAGGTVPRMGYFDMAGDPLSLAAERATLCLFLRRDLAPLERSYALLVPEDEATRLRDAMPRNRTSWAWVAWYARLGTQVADAPAADTTWSSRFPEAYGLRSDQLRATLSGNGGSLPPAGDGAVGVDPATGSFVLRTPRTCGGFVESGSVDAGDVRFDVGDVPATVWASSLDGKPLRTSARILLTHLTDVQNTGIRYAERSRQTLLAWGSTPHLARNGRAEVALAVDTAADWRIHALSTGGRRVAEVPSRVEGARLAFRAAVDVVPGTATLLYELVREP